MAEWFNGVFLCIELIHDFKNKFRPYFDFFHGRTLFLKSWVNFIHKKTPLNHSAVLIWNLHLASTRSIEYCLRGVVTLWRHRGRRQTIRPFCLKPPRHCCHTHTHTYWSQLMPEHFGVQWRLWLFPGSRSSISGCYGRWASIVVCSWLIVFFWVHQWVCFHISL